VSGPCTDCGGPDYQTLLARIAALEADLAMSDAALEEYHDLYEDFGEFALPVLKRRAERAEAENERLRVQHCDLIRCEGCEKTVESVDAEGWHRTDDDCDLCPKCWAEFVAEARAEEGSGDE